MRSIIPENAPAAPALAVIDPRERADRIADSTFEQMRTALSFLSTFYPDEFDHAMDVTRPQDPEASSPREAEPRCATCGASIGIFLRHGLDWQHYAGDGTTAGQQHIYDPGHASAVRWIIPDR